MHQKSTASASAQSAGIEDDEERVEARRDQGTDRALRNPFEDDGEDEIDDDSDDGLGEDGGNTDSWGSRTSRGGWWRGTLRSRERFGDGRDDSDSDKDDQAGAEDDDDDEFGDFAMPETDKDGDQTKASVIVKPLPVHPPPHNAKSSAFTSLWPFGSKEKEKPKGEESAVTAEAAGEAGHGHDHDHDHTTIKTTHEAARRTSIEDPDEDEVVV